MQGMSWGTKALATAVYEFMSSYTLLSLLSLLQTRLVWISVFWFKAKSKRIAINGHRFHKLTNLKKKNGSCKEWNSFIPGIILALKYWYSNTYFHVEIQAQCSFTNQLYRKFIYMVLLSVVLQSTWSFAMVEAVGAFHNGMKWDLECATPAV